MYAYTGPRTTELEPDDDAMLRFLSWWFGACNRGLIEIIAVNPKHGAPNQWERFDLHDIAEAVRRAASANTRPGVNIYFRSATVIVDDKNKATRDTHVVQIPGCWADCDDAEASERVLSPAGRQPCAVSSGGASPNLS
jgi:hypothetical protein